ncbi:MAG: hypothetical protein HN929_06060 [Chloroflexi bacterium]|jgi:hypothetical protein|nr:hypothetical protein [Chloroflexota bacterium]
MPTIRISEELFREIQKHAEPLVDSFETAVWKALGKRPRNIVERRFKSRSRVDVTPQKLFWKPILKTLVELGGEAQVTQVIDRVEALMKDTMRPGDYELNTDGRPKWTKAVNFQRLAMIHKGLLKAGTRWGMWAISEAGQLWLDSRKE